MTPCCNTVLSQTQSPISLRFLTKMTSLSTKSDNAMKLFLSILVFLLVLVIISFFVLDHLHDGEMRISKDEKNEVLVRLLGRAPISHEQKIDYSLKSYHGRYITFSYPAFLTIQKTHTTNDAILDSFFATSISPKLNLAIQVVKTDESLISFAGVTLRDKNSDIYKKIQVQAKSVSGVGYVKEIEPEITGFFDMGDKIVSVSVTGIDPDVNQKYFKQISASLY